MVKVKVCDLRKGTVRNNIKYKLLMKNDFFIKIPFSKIA